MKKLIIIFTLILGMAMAACTAKSNTTSSQETTIQDNKLSTELELVVGTFNLEGTEYDVTAEQAELLTTLWQAYQSIIGSDTTAGEEVTALVKQIQSTMTESQLEAITAMQLTNEDLMTLMQEEGVFTMQGGNPSISGTPSPNQIPGESFTIQQGMPSSGGGDFQPPSGGGPGQGAGGPPGGGIVIQGEFRGGEMDSNMSPEQLATAQAGRAMRVRNFGSVPLPLLNALIEYLQTK